jgi:hypothetical protein
MSILPSQCRAARALLDMGQALDGLERLRSSSIAGPTALPLEKHKQERRRRNDCGC